MASESPKLPPLPLLRALGMFRDALAALHRRLVPGHIALLEMQMTGFLAQAIPAAAQLGIADALAEGPRQPEDLARAIGADEDALRRLMRLLVSFDIFRERRDGSYELNSISQALRSEAPVTLRDLFLFFGSGYHRTHWTHLADAVRTGQPVGPAVDGASFFEYTAEHRDIGDLFDNAMTSISTLSVDPLLAAYDFGRFGTLVDLGGGQGSLLVDILRRTEAARGIVFDLPEVVKELSAHFEQVGLGDRLSVEAGSFFEAVPGGGDAYILKHIVHDWSDAEAERILRTVRAAMKPDATLLVIEIVIPKHGRPHPGKFIDLEMLINTTGRERSETDFGNLLARAGFALTRVVSTAAPDCVLEARPIR
ncbi:methyltransferase [Nocardia jejuensis]|uniref:methyltransferase n=1 Tax=Nocardia jejuensis TaxID=328049 RepID=UPI000834BBD6|nr:methyltransferase [Nocardia jejuensis]